MDHYECTLLTKHTFNFAVNESKIAFTRAEPSVAFLSLLFGYQDQLNIFKCL